MAGISVDTELVDVPSVKDLFRGLFGLEGSEQFLVSWGVAGAFIIITSSIGLVGTLLLLPLVIAMLVVGIVWLAYDRLR